MSRKPPASCSDLTSKEKTFGCCYNTTECMCSCCLLYITCPLTILLRTIRAPCRVGLYALKKVRQQMCCGAKKKVYAAYSTFSDTDSDSKQFKLRRRSDCFASL
ncbi:hypothetical protein ACJRO7_009990 [Eucalyptus globulus]|uniref:Uncharacterized protein n=1 Tax=Eucalyptus globulus TaxID=34317 RepID=A0ABD3LG63_EUCGL